MNSVQNGSHCYMYALKADQRNGMVNISPTNPALNPSTRSSLIYLQKKRAMAIVNYSSPTVCYSSNYSTTKHWFAIPKTMETMVTDKSVENDSSLYQNVCIVPKTVY